MFFPDGFPEGFASPSVIPAWKTDEPFYGDITPTHQVCWQGHTQCVAPTHLGMLAAHTQCVGVRLFYPFVTSFSMVLPPVTKRCVFGNIFRYIYLKYKLIQFTNQKNGQKRLSTFHLGIHLVQPPLYQSDTRQVDEVDRKACFLFFCRCPPVISMLFRHRNHAVYGSKTAWLRPATMVLGLHLLPSLFSNRPQTSITCNFDVVFIRLS